MLRCSSESTRPRERRGANITRFALEIHAKACRVILATTGGDRKRFRLGRDAMVVVTWRSMNKLSTPTVDANLGRRSLIKYMALGGVGGALGLARGANAKPKGKQTIPLGLQMWSVREECEKDFDAALSAVAKLGFTGVEFAGYHKYRDDAAGLRKKLDELGLKPAGTHIGTKFLEGDELAKTIAFHKTLGCSLLIVPSDKRFTDPAQHKAYAETMSKAAEALAKADMVCGYHNHTVEFDKVGNSTYWHSFADNTSKQVALELDIGWARKAGQDPVALMKAYPGRIRSVHVKAKPEEGKGKAFIGQDNYDWKRVLKACYDVGGTEWFFVEQEEYPDGKTPMQAAEISLAGLKKVLKGMNKLG